MSEELDKEEEESVIIENHPVDEQALSSTYRDQSQLYTSNGMPVATKKPAKRSNAVEANALMGQLQQRTAESSGIYGWPFHSLDFLSPLTMKPNKGSV
ncbi:hypothetical protein ScPMuIL_008995 [Solemya velum]